MESTSMLLIWLKLYKKNWFLNILIISLVLNAVLWLLLLFRAIPTTDSVPLHYSLTFGIDWLGSWGKLFTYPVFGLLMIVFNTWLAVVMYSINKFLAILLLIIPVFAHLIAGLSIYTLLLNYY